MLADYVIILSVHIKVKLTHHLVIFMTGCKLYNSTSEFVDKTYFQTFQYTTGLVV